MNTLVLSYPKYEVVGLECNGIVQPEVYVQAHIAATPDAQIEDVKAYSVGTPITDHCTVREGECVCTVRQLLYVEFKLTISLKPEDLPAISPSNQPAQLTSSPTCDTPPLCPPTAVKRPRRRPLLFVLADMLRNSFFCSRNSAGHP